MVLGFSLPPLAQIPLAWYLSPPMLTKLHYVYKPSVRCGLGRGALFLII